MTCKFKSLSKRGVAFFSLAKNIKNGTHVCRPRKTVYLDTFDNQDVEFKEIYRVLNRLLETARENPKQGIQRMQDNGLVKADGSVAWK